MYLNPIRLLFVLFLFFPLTSSASSDRQEQQEQAMKGDLIAQVKLAETYLYGENTPQDDQQALFWLEQILSHTADSTYDGYRSYLRKNTLYKFIYMAYKKGNYQQAINWCEQLIEEGPAHTGAEKLLPILYIAYFHSTYAQTPTAVLFDADNQKLRNDQIMQNWYKEFANPYEQEIGMYYLGVFFDDQNHPWSSRDKALDWYNKAAELGSSAALNILGLTVEEASPELAAEYYQKALAADYGNIAAMVNLGKLYYWQKVTSGNAETDDVFAYLLLKTSISNSSNSESYQADLILKMLKARLQPEFVKQIDAIDGYQYLTILENAITYKVARQKPSDNQ